MVSDGTKRAADGHRTGRPCTELWCGRGCLLRRGTPRRSKDCQTTARPTCARETDLARPGAWTLGGWRRNKLGAG